MTTHQPIESSLACVWTDAGILRDRLCDRGFACESCPLDAALKRSDRAMQTDIDELTFETIAVGIPEGIGSIPATVVQPFLRLAICNECRYSDTHIWLRRDSAGLLWCGLDAFGASLLPRNAEIICVARNVHVQEREPFAWMYAGDCVLPLLSPISGTVVERRHEGTATSATFLAHPYESGSLVAFLPDPGAVRKSNTHSAIEQAAHLRHDARRLLATVTRNARRHELETGFCLNDGGVPVGDIREFLGDKSYTSLVRSFLCGE